MTCLVHLGREKKGFKQFYQALCQHLNASPAKDIQWVDSDRDLLGLLADSPMAMDLLVIEESYHDIDAKTLVTEVVSQNPATSCVVASLRDETQFHEMFEGLGVLMQLSFQPTSENAKTLAARLDKISRLSQTIAVTKKRR